MDASPSAPLAPPVCLPAGEAAATGCRHCGTTLQDARSRETGFCCAGCAYVFRLVHEQGLGGYYRMRDDVTAPAEGAVFEPRDYAWLEVAQREAEAATTGVPELVLDVQGVSCAACVWLIERVYQRMPGAGDIVVNAQYGTMRLRWVRGEFTAVDFARKLQTFGYLAGPAGATEEEPESRGLVKRIGLCAALAMNVMLFSLPVYFGMERTFEWAGLFGVLNVVFGTLSLLVGGTYFLGRAVRALRSRALHIDLPIGLGIVGAYAGSLYGWFAGEERFVYFDFVSAFILLMLVGRWAQVAAVERNRRRLLRHQLLPRRVRLAEGGEVELERLVENHTLLVAAGGTLPVEGRLEGAAAAFSLASISGEAEPRVVQPGQRVPSGAVNVGREAVRVVAGQRWADSLLAQLLRTEDRTEERHPLLERIVRGYLAGILGVAVVAGLAWWWATGDALRTWAVVTAVLVVSCPCAVALAFPLADEMATVALRRRGVFVRQADLWPKLSRVRRIVFDKTGTLTLETPELRDPAALVALSGEARAALLALVKDNAHPVSQALLGHLLTLGPLTAAPGQVAETVGQGLTLGEWSLGRPGWQGGRDAADSGAAADADLVHAGVVVARFRFADAPRPGVREELRALAERGLEVVILSGDRAEKVTALARELGVPAVAAFGGQTPQDKAAWLGAAGGRQDALMLGDGANDSLAFDAALCRGTPVIHRGVLERKADFYYLGRGIGGVRALFEVDALRRRTHRMVLVFSVAYNALAVGLAVAGRMNPLVAAALMPINSLLTLGLVTGGMRAAFRR